ncbi:hypothetical protein D4R47_03380 [archaeon]|nr:MAG: hypothetical protein D4R47_03380 [archaeon]
MGVGSMKRFTKSELKNYNGEDGKPIYVAFDNKVYDLSDSRLWADGRHMGVHSAGAELSGSIENAPHDAEVLSRFPIVGELAREEHAPESLAQRIADLYPHPIIVHFPIAFSTTVSLFSILYLLTGEASFELASYYILTLGLLASPFCGLSGVFSWKINYKGVMNNTFSRKIWFTVALMSVTMVCFIWRLLDPTVLVGKTNMSYVYLVMQICMALIAAVLGHTGGKIVFSK